MYGRLYTPEQVAFLRDHIAGRTHAELTALFNERFDETRTVGQITSACKNRKLCNGLDFRFSKGHVPFNKNRKGIRVSQASEFKKGHVPWNHRPVGAERVNADGYVEVKIADPKKWRGKHLLVWEAENGPVPKGHTVIFGDGDRMNITLDNLVLVSRAQLAVMNKFGLIGGSAELTKTGKLVADVHMAATKRLRK